MRPLFFLLLVSFSAFSQTKIMMIGGGKRPADVLQKFAVESKNGKILVITWASGEPEASFEAIKNDFEKIGIQTLIHAPHSIASPENTTDLLQLLNHCSAVYFTGGDQNRIMEILKNSELKDALIRKYEAGFIFGGTSAGTAIMSEIMITGKGDLSVIDSKKVETAPGLGLLKNMIVDQHFIKRQRQNRLMSLLLKHSKLYGAGIDEDTALYIENGRNATIYGESQVMIFQRKKNNFNVILLNKGDRFVFKQPRN